MPTYTFNSTVGDAIADDMVSASKTIVSLLNQQREEIKSRLSEWEDAAADEYEAKRLEWENIANNMGPKLQYIRQVLDQIIENYIRTTQQGVSTWNGYSAK